MMTMTTLTAMTALTTTPATPRPLEDIVVGILMTAGLPREVGKRIYAMRRSDYDAHQLKVMGLHYRAAALHIFLIQQRGAVVGARLDYEIREPGWGAALEAFPNQYWLHPGPPRPHTPPLRERLSGLLRRLVMSHHAVEPLAPGAHYFAEMVLWNDSSMRLRYVDDEGDYTDEEDPVWWAAMDIAGWTEDSFNGGLLD